MPDSANARSAAKEFWEFSLALYAQPGVGDALILLQDRDKRDVNLILFAAWLGVSGRGRLDAAALAHAERAVRRLRRQLITPLRHLRRRLKSDPDGEIQTLRERIKGLELDAERLAQSRLAALAGPAAPYFSRSERRAAAADNLAFYLGAADASPEAALLRDSLMSFSA